MEVKELKTLVKLVKGKKPKSLFETKTKTHSEPYLLAKVIRGTEKPKFGKEDEMVVVSPADLVIISDGDAGEVFQGLSGGLASTMSKIEPLDNINLKYLKYFLISNRKLFSDTRTGAAIPHLNKDIFFNLQIPVPSLQKQKKIVERLDKVFDNIDTKINQKITLNNQYKKYINSYIEKELFQEKNPVKLKDLINVKRKNINNYSNKFIGLENIVSNTSEVVNVESIAVKSNTYKFDKGSLLYGRLRPYLNKVTIVDFDGHCSTEIFPIDTTKELNIKYLKYFLMTQKTVNKINLQTTGARMPRASVSVLENLKIDLKSQKEQSINVEIFDNLTTLIQNIVKVNLKIIENSKLLKKSILNKEFSYE